MKYRLQRERERERERESRRKRERERERERKRGRKSLNVSFLIGNWLSEREKKEIKYIFSW